MHPTLIVLLATAAFAITTIGPIMLAVGAALMSNPREREALVDAYNEAVRGYDPSTMPIITGAVLATKTTHKSSREPIAMRDEPMSPLMKNAEDDVESVSSTYATTVTYADPMSFYDVNVVDSDGDDIVIKHTSNALHQAMVLTRKIYGDCDKDECDNSYMRHRCIYLGGYYTSFVRNTGVRYDVCGETTLPQQQTYQRGLCYECEATRALQEICLVITKKPDGTYSEHPTLKSCYYPFETESYKYFGASDYHPIPNSDRDHVAGEDLVPQPRPSVKVSLRLDNDPFIVAQRLTKGTMDLGPLAMASGAWASPS